MRQLAITTEQLILQGVESLFASTHSLREKKRKEEGANVLIERAPAPARLPVCQYVKFGSNTLSNSMHILPLQ